MKRLNESTLSNDEPKRKRLRFSHELDVKLIEGRTVDECIQMEFANRERDMLDELAQQQKEIDKLKYALAQMIHEKLQFQKIIQHISQKVGKRICKGCSKVDEMVFYCNVNCVEKHV